MSDASRQRIARDTGIIFAGTVISMLFGFLSRDTIAREAEYGVFNLVLTVMSIGLGIVMAPTWCENHER